MKISEAITKLQETKEIFGDVDVIFAEENRLNNREFRKTSFYNCKISAFSRKDGIVAVIYKEQMEKGI